MSREVRRVPGNWEHPKNRNGGYKPLHDGDYKEILKKWEQGKDKWEIEGLRKNWSDGVWMKIEDKFKNLSYEEWEREKPEKYDYMPCWSEEEKTHLMMYETTTEGTPISPAFKTAEELARWLADNDASTIGDLTTTYENWLKMIG
jgi:hypothetical protein